MGGLGKKINKDLNAKRKEQEKIDVKKAKEAIEETKLSEEKKEELKEVVDEYKNASEDVLKGMPKIPAWLIKGAPPPRSYVPPNKKKGKFKPSLSKVDEEHLEKADHSKEGEKKYKEERAKGASVKEAHKEAKKESLNLH